MSVVVWPIKHGAPTPLWSYSAGVYLLIPQLQHPRKRAKMGEQFWASWPWHSSFPLPIHLYLLFKQTAMSLGLSLWKALKLHRSSNLHHVKEWYWARARGCTFPIQYRSNTAIPTLSAHFYSYILLVRRKHRLFTGSPLLSYLET